jgi:hypothetical protein
MKADNESKLLGVVVMRKEGPEIKPKNNKATYGKVTGV